MANESVYMDANAGLPLHPKVFEECAQYFNMTNPSNNIIAPGELAADAYDKSINSIKSTLGSNSDTIIMTSGATESNATILHNIREIYPSGHVVVPLSNHPSIIAYINETHMNATFCDDSEIIRSIQPNKTVLICLSHVNSLNGKVTNIRKISQESKAICPAFILCDATQSVGKIKVCRYRLGADFLTFSAHKFGGPKGVGGLLISPKVFANPTFRFVPLIPGAQQGGMRGGTLNVAGVAMTAHALKYAIERMERFGEQTRTKISKLHSALSKQYHVESLSDTTGTTIYITIDKPAKEVAKKLSERGFHVGVGCACQTQHGADHLRISVQLGEKFSIKQFLSAFSAAMRTTKPHAEPTMNHIGTLDIMKLAYEN